MAKLLFACVLATNVFARAVISITELRTAAISNTTLTHQLSLDVGPGFMGDDEVYSEDINFIDFVGNVHHWNGGNWLNFFDDELPTFAISINNENEGLIYQPVICGRTGSSEADVLRQFVHRGWNNTQYQTSYKCKFTGALAGSSGGPPPNVMIDHHVLNHVRGFEGHMDRNKTF